MAKTITGIKVGQTTITATYTEGGVTKTSSIANFTVSKADGYVSTAPTNSSAVYGSGSYLCSAGSGTGTMMYRVGTTGNFSSTRPTTSGLNAGTYPVYYYAAESTSYTQSPTESISVTVEKATGAATVTGLTKTYNGTTNSNGTAQDMVSVSGNTGTMHYRVGSSGTWTTTIPTRTNVGSDTIYYYMDASTNYTAKGSSSEPWGSVTGTMNRAKTASASAVTGLVYNGTTEDNSTASSQTGVSGTHVTWTGTTSAKNAGSYSATATPESNFAWSDGGITGSSVSWSIARRGQTAPVLNGAETTYPTTASASVKTAGTVSGGTAAAPGTLTWSNQSRSTAGSQTATAYYAATTTNFSASPVSSGVTVKVNPHEGTATVSGLTKTYNGTTNSNGTAQNMVSVSDNTGTMHYRVGTGGTWTTTIPTRINAGSDTIYYYMDASTNYTARGSSSEPWGYVTGTMNRAKTASYSSSNKTYNGTNDTNGTSQTAVTGTHATLSGSTSGTNAGSYTAYATPESNFAWSDGTYAQKTITWTMNKRGQGAPTLQGAETDFPTTATATVKTAGVIDGGTTTCPGTLTWSNQSRSNAGSQTATAYYAATDNFSQSPTSSGVTVKVNPKEGEATVSGLTKTYNGTTNSNGTAQNMVSVSDNTGTMHYRVGTGGTWTTTIPTRINAGSDTIYYYMDASSDGNYTARGSSSSPWGSVTGTMNRAKTASYSSSNKTYNGTTESNGTSQTGVTGTHVTLTGNTSGTNAGDYTAYATPESNFAWSDGTYTQKTINWSIARRAQGAPTLQGAETTYPTTATATVKTAGVVDGGTATCPGTLTWTNQSRSNAGSQTATAYYAATTTNFSESPVSSGVTVKVNKADGVVKTAPTNSGVTYGSGSNLCSAGASDTGTMQYKLDSGSWSSTIPTATTSISAGNHTLYYRAAESTNYNQSSEDSITVTVDQKGVTVSWGTTSWVYDGTSHNTSCSITNGVISGTTCTVSLSGNSVGSNVGNATVTASLSNANYKISSGGSSKTISITPRPIKVTAASSSRAYNGAALTNNNATAEVTGSGRGLVSGHSMTSCTVTGSQTTVGSSNNVPSAAVIKDGSNNTVTTNYDIEYVNGTLTITSGTLTVTATAYNATYDGAAHAGITAISAKNQENTAVTPSYTYCTTQNGTYTTTIPTVQNYTTGTTIYWKAELSGYTTATGSVSAKVSKKACTVTAGSDSKTYDGTALTKNSATATGLVSGHQMTAYTVTGSQTYVGSSDNVVNDGSVVIKSGTTTVTDNYLITRAKGTLTISKADPQISIQGITESYTGGEFYAKVISTKAKGTLYWKKGSAASTSDTAVTINSTGTPLSTPINITYVKDNSDDFVLYWYFVPSSTANSLASGHTYAENYNTSGGTSNDNVNLTINPRNISNVTASATNVTYNASSQTASVSISDSGATLTSNDYTISGNTKTNAGDYTITITGKNNYTGTKTISWTIIKRNVTITAGSDSKTYDGTALTKNTVSASAQSGNTGMISSHHVHSWTVSGSQTLAGSSDNVVSAATIYDGTHNGTEGNVSSNYNISFAKGTLTVSPREVTYKADNQSKTYDGTALSATNTATITSGSLPTGHTATPACSGSVGPNVGSATKTLSGVVIKNGSGTDVSSSFTITKNNGTLSITNATITYSTSSSVSKYCTDSAVATTTTIGNRTITIASASATDYAGNAITNGSTPATQGYTISQSGWSISSDGKTITVPGDVAADTYNITVTANKPNHTSKTNNIQVVINAVALSGIEMELNSTTVKYLGSTTVKRVTATYTNGATKDVKDDLVPNASTGNRINAADTTIVEITTT